MINYQNLSLTQITTWGCFIEGVKASREKKLSIEDGRLILLLGTYYRLFLLTLEAIFFPK
jgi:hypothetical protein